MADRARATPDLITLWISNDRDIRGNRTEDSTAAARSA